MISYLISKPTVPLGTSQEFFVKYEKKEKRILLSMIAVILLLNAVLFGLEALDTEALEIVVGISVLCMLAHVCWYCKKIEKEDQ